MSTRQTVTINPQLLAWAGAHLFHGCRLYRPRCHGPSECGLSRRSGWQAHADIEGNLYLAQHDGNRQNPKSELTVIDRVGKVLGTIPLSSGRGLTTNVGFGRGTDANSLYVSTAAPWGLLRIKTAKRGHYF